MHIFSDIYRIFEFLGENTINLVDLAQKYDVKNYSL